MEGDLEQKFIQNVCPGAPVRKINCNGDDTRLEAIAKRVGTLARLVPKRCSLLVVVFDREGRIESSADMEMRFRELLKNEGLDTPVIVGIPDRNIESWILGDLLQFALSAELKSAPPDISFEGKCGKLSIKKLLENGTRYVETIDGVRWLKSARPDVIQLHSPSFKRFAVALKALECWWLKELHLKLN